MPDILSKLLKHEDFIEYLGLSKMNFILSAFLIFFLETVHYIQNKWSISEIFIKKSIYFRWFVYIIFIWSIIFLGIFENRQFIYFQF